KPSKVALWLQDWHAGKKVVVINQLDKGTKEQPHLHTIVASIVEYYPHKLTHCTTRRSHTRVRPRAASQSTLDPAGRCEELCCHLIVLVLPSLPFRLTTPELLFSVPCLGIPT
ncbi:hypothetical protein K438DRAFT_2088507, partial [Mycena galopus ATCC 62051]